ncbi:ABC-F type ribosomal protection protein [Clostridiaceae bacterium 35-E11]
MLLIECINIKKYFGDRLILAVENLKIYSEDRIGIVGVNGVGKTTLLNILSQKLQPDEGWIKLYADYAYISQLEPPENKSISYEMASKFGVASTWNEKMSGGEKNRFKLAQSLSKDHLLIFADEPTSNVDIEGIEMMENMLEEYKGALMLISHDRSFLDKLCNKILEIENGKIKIYKGNFSDYYVQKIKERERAQFEYDEYKREKRRLEEAINDKKQQTKRMKKTPKRMGNSEARLHKMGNQKAKANLERTAKSIETRIKHLEVKEKLVEQACIRLDLEESNKLYSKIVIEGQNMHKAFDEKIIFNNAEFSIYNGSKIALIGPNGCGKSTFVKMIMNEDSSIRIAQGAKIGYFSQDLSILDENLTIIENIMKNSIYPEPFVRTLLARLLFKREEIYKKVRVLSGGERVKASFANILLQEINLLILDEPTNYMDIDSLEVVEEALREYDRTLLFISHDRRFINAVADHIMTIENQKINMFRGNYDEFLMSICKRQEHSIEEIKKQLYVLENRLSEVVSRLSMPTKKDDVAALDKQYYEILDKRNRLKERLER